MENINSKYYEPLEQMMSIRHQYMAKMILSLRGINIYKFFKNKQILDLGCGTGKFLDNYHELGSYCTGIDIIENFQVKNKKNFNLKKIDFRIFLKKNKKNYDAIFIYEFLEHLSTNDRENLFKIIPKILKKNGLVFLSTLNKNLVSEFLSIDIAENFFKLLPKNTHDPKLFLKPSEIEILSNQNNLKLLNVQGMSYNPLIKAFKFTKVSLVNYLATISF